MITIDEIRALLKYDPATGNLHWIVRAANCVQVGQPAGNRRRNGYVFVGVRKHKLAAHRVAWALMTGEWPAGFIDHIDRDPSNNRWDNLRLATPSQNNANAIRARSKTKGTTRLPSGRYMAQIKFRGVSRYLGCFDTVEEAQAEYHAQAIELYGEFARVSE